MSMNCLNRINSEEEMKPDELQEDYKPNNYIHFWAVAGRSLSGNLEPNFKPKPNYDKMRSWSSLDPIQEKSPLGCRPTTFGSGPPSPRLVRSSGMRRDWSFEDLREAIKG
ncbi:phospholipase D alpha 1 [Striga asiatica]|uniref:Phospholipase D alpha 1 n=1 Tax=Striga asiatica TaxID=4170 RepID=A0A5A7R1J7_STRAF|nr:phospholipase D alpha 1 [Striga asiatica]